MPKFSAVNCDTIDGVAGDIVKSYGSAFGVTRATADSATLSLVGVWSIPATRGHVGEVTTGDLVEVNCTSSVNVGDKLYLSSIVPGKATKTAPAYPYFIGIVLAKRIEGSTQKATIIFTNRGLDVSDTQRAVLNGKPASGSITCLAVEDISDNDRFTLGDGSALGKFEYHVTPQVYATGSITCPARSAFVDNETFTLDDGVNDPVVFEIKKTKDVYATGSITAVAKADLVDNETFTLDDGVNDPVVFEFQVTQDIYATGSITCPERAKFNNNETVTLNDGVNEPTVIEFHVSKDAYATGTITCPVAANLFDNETVTLNDGVNPPTVIEFKRSINAYATGTITCPERTKFNNNETVTLNDGVNPPTVIEFKRSINAYATGSITAVAKANLLNNETFTLDDGVNDPVVFEFNVTGDVCASGSIEVVDYTKLVDNDTFVINDGVNTVVFEFDVSGTYDPTPTFIPVSINGLTSNAAVAGAIKDAINGVVEGLTVTAGEVVGATVPLVNDNYGFFNETITNGAAAGALTCVGMADGAIFVPAGGDVVVVDIAGNTLDTDVIATIKATINAQDANLAITAGDITGATVELTNDAYGLYNAEITTTVADAGFIVAGMANGEIWTPTGGDVAVCDISGCNTANDVAVALSDTINLIQEGLAITAGVPVDDMFDLTNDAYGTYNDAITTTVADAGFIVAGMANGEIWTPTGGDVAVCDISGVTTEAQVANCLKVAINGVLNELAITSSEPDGATITLTNDAYGPYNDAITTTVADEGFIVSGMADGETDDFVATGGDVAVCDISGCNTANDVAVALSDTINAQDANLAITADVPVDDTFDLTNDAYGAYNDAIETTVADEGFIVSGMSGGEAELFVASGGAVIPVDVTGATTAASVALIIKNTINAQVETLAITAGDITDATVELTNDAYGFYNDAIVTNVSSEDFVVDGMSGGEEDLFVASGGAVVVCDISEDETAAEVAATVADTINAQVGTLTITAGDVEDATVPLTNDNYGEYNEDIATDVASEDFVVEGMSGGSGTNTTADYTMINLVGLTTALEVALETYAFIIAAELSLDIPVPVSEVISIQNTAVGVAGNVAMTQPAGSLVLAGMSGGVDAVS